MMTSNDHKKQRPPERGSWMRKVAASLMVSVFAVTLTLGGVFGQPKAAHAQFAEVNQGIWNAWHTVENSFVEGAVLALVNGTNYFASQMAYQAALALTSSCPGQVICWDSKSFRQGFTEAWQGAIGEAVGTLSEEGGFTKLGFNLCNPGIPGLKIQLGLLDEVAPPPPKCDFEKLVNDWSNFRDSFTSGEVLNKLKPTFEKGSSPLAVSLGTWDILSEKRAEAERDYAMKRFSDAAAGGGFSGISDMISGRLKSPAAVTKDEFARMRQYQLDDTATNMWAAGQIAKGAVTSVVLNTVQTFTQTLVTQLWNKMANGLLSMEELVAGQPDLVLNPEALLQPPGTTNQEAAQQVRNSVVSLRDSGLVDPLLEFTVCPGNNRSAKNCVLDQQFAAAVRVADATPITVSEALRQGYLHGDWPLISSKDSAKDQDAFCYTYAYCESNLKKLRAARIIPIGWEIAASKSSLTKPLTLQAVVDGFSHCNASGAMDDTHPYCKLIDPDWVLRIPLTQCRAVGYGEQLVAPNIPTRTEICVDQQTCLLQDDNGNCVGGWGYCTKERNIWRFNGDSCPAQFNTCRVLTARSGGTRAYNLNTIEHGVCSSDNVGCRRYSAAMNVVKCTLPQTGTGITSGRCNADGGCPCSVRSASCDVTRNEESCTDASNGRTCQLGGTCTGTSCACTVNVSCQVAKGESGCTSASGSQTVAGDDWLSDPARFFTAKVQTCDANAGGCTALVRLAPGQALNLIRNGSFEETEDGDADGTPDHPKYWSPFGVTPANVIGSVRRDAALAASGSSAILVKGTPPSVTSSTCTLSSACDKSQGCACKTSAGYSCRVAMGVSRCSATGRVIQDGLPISKNLTYTLSFVAIPETGTSVGVSAVIGVRNMLGDSTTLSATNVVTSASVSGHATGTTPTATCAADSNGDLVFTVRGTKSSTAGVKGLTGSCTFVIVGGNPAQGHVEFKADGSNAAYVDNVQLEEGGGTPFHEGYGDTLGNVNAKIPPAALGCTGEPGDPAECGNYAGICRENEVGCDAYLPVNGDPSVPGIVGPQDTCPQACAGYDVFKQEGTSFDQPKFPVYFIPSTAAICSEADVGCSQFTSVDTEAVSYFSKLRLCTKPEDPTNGTYYSWEGSDTTGYQLRVWNFKNTTTSSGVVAPVTAATAAAVAAGTASDACAGASCVNAGPAPCTKLDANAQHCVSRAVGVTSGSTEGLCDRDAIDAGNLDCREFYDASGNRHYRLLSKTIIASAECNAYRITTSTSADCANSNGRWDATKAQCIYNADAAQSRSCAAAVNNCRAYKGNAASNSRVLILDGFESGMTRWTDATDRGVTGFEQSAEAVTVGGHSAKIRYSSGSSAARVIGAEVGGMVAPSRVYTLSFWARGTGTIASAFRDGKEAVSCTLSSACAPASGSTSCPCATATGLTCNVSSGSSTCSVAVASPATPVQAFKPDAVALTSEWRQYSVGPVTVNPPTGSAPAFGTRSVKLTLTAGGICVGGTNAGNACSGSSGCSGGSCVQSDVYVDNVQLKEVQDSIFVVRDSWKTPASCDLTANGVPSPQEMLGCREYKKSSGESVYLRSFSRLCREQAIGCSAYSDTRNTPDNPYGESFNAVCRLSNVCGGTADSPSTPNGGSSCICNYNTKHPGAVTSGAGQMLSDVCRVAIGASECRFHLDREDFSTRVDENPDRVNVSADRRAYLVVRQQNLCGGDQIGCTLMGRANEVYETQCTYTQNGAPAKCEAKRCSVSGTSCSTTANCNGSAADICVPSFCPCSAGGSSCQVAFGDGSCAVALDRPLIDKWTTGVVKDLPASYDQTLCKEEAAGCDAFSASDGIQYFKDPGDHVCQYQEGVSYAGQTRSGWFRKSTSGSYFPCYPELLRQGSTYDIYKNADPVCRMATACTNAQGCDCTLPGNPVPVCKILQGGTVCGYQGWVGLCEAKYDRCEEFVDPAQTSVSHPAGQPYYYIQNGKLDLQSCAGSASLKQGCVLFKQTSNTASLYSAATTYYKSQRDARNGKVGPVNCNLNTNDPACNNRCVSIPVGSCSEDGDWECHQDSDCRRCSNNNDVICKSNADCGGGGATCGATQACVGTKAYTASCQSDIDCNRGIGELCAGDSSPKRCSATKTRACNANADCPTGETCSSPMAIDAAAKRTELANDANVIIKVNQDRACAEWLSCLSHDTVWNEQKGQYRTVCSGFGPCTENKQVGSAFECTQPVEPKKKVFTNVDYSKRDTSWNGVEYSGYSIPERYSPAFLYPVSIVKGRCIGLAGEVMPGPAGQPDIQCLSSGDCEVGNVQGTCRFLSGICQDSGVLTGRSCDMNEDCCTKNRDGNCIGNAYCSYNYVNTHRFATILDAERSCVSSNDCTRAKTGFATDGTCIDHVCAYNFDGGAFSADRPEWSPSCRAYPESDAPYGSTVIDSSGSQEGHPGYDTYGAPQSKESAFSAASVCGRGNDCSCSYTRWQYGAGGGVSRFLSYPGSSASGPIFYDGDQQRRPLALSREGVCVGGPYEGKQCDATQSISSADPCDSASGGRCQKLTSVSYNNGWKGFCLDLDKSLNTKGDPNSFDCNLWLPVDQLAGASDDFNQFEEAGFNPPDQQLLYCAAAQGNAYGTDPADPYRYLIYSDDTSSANIHLFSIGVDGQGARIISSAADGAAAGGGSGAFTAIGAPGGIISGAVIGAVSGAFSDEETYSSMVRQPSRNIVTNKNGSYELQASQSVSPSQPDLYKNQIVGFEMQGRFWCDDDEPSKKVDISFYLTEENQWYNDVEWNEDAYRPSPSGLRGDHRGDYCRDIWDGGDQDRSGQDGEPINCMALEAQFDAATGKFTGLKALIAHDDEESCEPIMPIKVYALMRESCMEISQVHDAAAPGLARNFAWTDRVYQGTKHELLDVNGFQGSPLTARGGVINGVLAPYGRIEPSGLQIIPKSGTAANPNNREKLGIRYPVSVFQTEGGSKYSYLMMDDTKEPPENPYNFNGPNKELLPSTQAGADVYDAGGYPYACKGPCANLLVSNKGTMSATRTAGRTSLSQYFAWSFRTFFYNPETGVRDLSLRPAFQGMYESSRGYDFRETHAGGGEPPKVVAVRRANCSGNQTGLCEEGLYDPSGRNGLTVNMNEGLFGNEVSPDDGKFRVSISFYAYADKNRMPIRRKIIDYGDGTPPKETSGAFKNHRGCPNGKAGCGTETKPFCGFPSIGSADAWPEWGNTLESCDPRYFQETHTYVCTAAMVGTGSGSLPACSSTTPRYPCKGAVPGDNRTACHFKPRVQILDNWGFCNGRCGGAPGGDQCFNRGVGSNNADATGTFTPTWMSSIFKITNMDAINTCSNGVCTLTTQAPASPASQRNTAWNECRNLTNRLYKTPITVGSQTVDQQPWTEFGQEIIVFPR